MRMDRWQPGIATLAWEGVPFERTAKPIEFLVRVSTGQIKVRPKVEWDGWWEGEEVMAAVDAIQISTEDGEHVGDVRLNALGWGHSVVTLLSS